MKNKEIGEEEKEMYLLRIPSDEYYSLDLKTEFIRKKGQTMWIRMTVVANGKDKIAWYEWERNE